jgi:hypothetical protein
MRTSVRRDSPSIAVLTLVLAGSTAAMAREHAAHSSQIDQQVANVPPVQLIIGGVVRRVLGSGVFILDDPYATDRELMVLVPDAEATPVAGASVVARGLLRRFDEAELEKIRVWNELDLTSTPGRRSVHGRSSLRHR